MICNHCGKHLMVGDLDWSFRDSTAEFSCYHCGQKYKITALKPKTPIDTHAKRTEETQ